MIVDTAKLISDALDWAAGQCEYRRVQPDGGIYLPNHGCRVEDFQPSYSWCQGGPIIERARLLVRPEPGGSWSSWKHGAELPCYSSGRTPLVAAMRCYVTSKLGASVDIPDSLAKWVDS